MGIQETLRDAFVVYGVSKETKRKFVEWYVKAGNPYACLERVVYEASIDDRKVRRLFDELISAKIMEENVDENTRTPVNDEFEHPEQGVIRTPGYRFEDKYYEVLKDRNFLDQLLQ